MWQNSAINVQTSIIREMKAVWNDPEIGIEWPQLTGEYQGNASAEGYTLEDGTPLNLSDKDQKWAPLRDTFKF